MTVSEEKMLSDFIMVEYYLRCYMCIKEAKSDYERRDQFFNRIKQEGWTVHEGLCMVRCPECSKLEVK